MSSPSEFLTFYRRLANPNALKKCRVLPRPQPVRAITYTAPARKGPSSDKNHATDKSERLDVQSDSSFSAREEKVKGVGGAATKQKDERGGKDMAKKEHPEMPANNAGIGFQDERGGKPQ
ncbi:hypothetical protein C1H76_4225 [Elsinoe australis]|uniref:Uncharacterized protein n=1 Tax=Elsinoe australis TaxID=40998 RepID=A0A4U7AYE9_9PEZI|nr:hypothetical protein C1H76_4225 [Elsinoe australis]